MSVVAVVPMKGHSERVPRKNLREIAGRPLYQWILSALTNASLVDDLFVDTDSDEISEAVVDAFPNVSLHRRPEHLHGDLVPMHDVVNEFARTVDHEHVLQTHSTNPLLKSETIDAAIEAYLADTAHDSLMGVTARQSRFFFADGRPVNHDPRVLMRTQDLEPLLEENSCLYISRRDQIVRTGMRVGLDPLLFVVNRREAIDIDDQFDLEVADLLLRSSK